MYGRASCRDVQFCPPVHTHCGFPVKAAQDMWHGLDLHADETLFWITDIGWMMGRWLVFGTLLLGATMVLYDGAPDFPGLGSPLAARRAASRHHARHFADARPRAYPPRRRAGAGARSLIAAQAQLDGRAVESRPVALAFRDGWWRYADRSSTTPAAPRSAAAS